ncbi:hypothetical protein CRE_10609 [Caenorhabditis remanei]|uniref:RING-type domain-containing protein n=1 Tax=Caenorhabditis remanei TaxID=31234 RepID=E3NBM8_CAERE|nr:hypothetical protein CRE_10609 [Caenorhabditis remanei]
MCSALALRANNSKLKLWSFIFACVGLTVTGFAPRIAVFIWEIPPQLIILRLKRVTSRPGSTRFGSVCKFKCDDCFLEYTDILIPRVLKDCGHTICEDCADELLAENYQRHLRCPVCNKVTLVYGTGKMLPRNYVITDLMAMAN